MNDSLHVKSKFLSRAPFQYQTNADSDFTVIISFFMKPRITRLLLISNILIKLREPSGVKLVYQAQYSTFSFVITPFRSSFALCTYTLHTQLSISIRVSLVMSFLTYKQVKYRRAMNLLSHHGQMLYSRTLRLIPSCVAFSHRAP